MRHLVLVLGDQLDVNSAAFSGFDASQDAVWMAEVQEEATHVWCHKLRLAGFFSAMRHFRNELRSKNIDVSYHELTSDQAKDHGRDFRALLRNQVKASRPEKLILLQPGDHRVLNAIQDEAAELTISLEVRPDDHFYCGIDEFAEWAKGRKRMVMEDFYRRMRQKHNVLMTSSGDPMGGEWNYDSDNRESFGKGGPGKVKAPRSFQVDDISQEVIRMVEQRFSDHPGTCEHFDLPVTHKQARELLRDFIKHRLPDFGKWQDAIWMDQPFLYHSRLSFALNLHLIRPLECVDAAVAAYEAGEAPINSVEGFVRQILGWREFIRGIYWKEMPYYIEQNALRCGDVDVPSCFWDGETDMRCIRDAMQSVLKHGYAHHIQRLMVLGLFSQLVGVHPRRFHDWHMAMYVDAIDWISLPNTLGMSQYGDGGIVGTKPYCASGNYINKMSNCCSDCRFNPKEATGEKACPFTTLYWDFLDRHRDQFSKNARMKFQMKNLDRKDEQEMRAIRLQASRVKDFV
ncbi:MAG: cryptochrome/photolyase family protein [Planctomycetaceae bacterium]|nr:cryptochrome/photolyase family protein [Planctomycetaceae bacterium]